MEAKAKATTTNFCHASRFNVSSSRSYARRAPNVRKLVLFSNDQISPICFVRDLLIAIAEIRFLVGG